MRNILQIFRQDVSSLFRNVMSVVLVIGLVVLPSLFAWYNILACWDVFENTGNLSVAVANEDEGFKSDLIPIEVNVGDKVVSALRANDQIGWVITGGEDAVEGTKAGKYYAALVIPENFSHDLLTFYEGDGEPVDIVYYVNEKKNAIAPNITGAGADAVSQEVNSAFSETMAEVASGFGQSILTAADDLDADGRIARLAEHMRSLSSGIDNAADVLGMYSSLAEDSQELVTSSAEFLESAKSQLEDNLSGVSVDKDSLKKLADKLSTAADELSSSLESSLSSLSELESEIDPLLSNASDDSAAIAGQLRDVASRIDGRSGELGQIRSTLEQLREQLSDFPALSVVLDADIAALTKAIDILDDASAELKDAAGKIESGNADLQSKAANLRKLLESTKGDIKSVKSEIQKNLKPGIDELKADLKTLAGNLDDAVSRIKSAGSSLPGIASSVSSALGEASGGIDSAYGKLHDSAKRIRELADSIDEALASGDVEQLRSLLSGNIDELVTALTAPVSVERTALFPVENFGSAMTPLYCTLALFIGSLLIMVALNTVVSQRRRETLHNVKPRQLYFGRFGVVGLLSLMQTTLMGLGTMLFLKVQVAHPLLFMLCFWAAGLVFAFIVYTLVVSFGNLGKAIAVLLLIVSVTGCGGSFPLEILPGFIQKISPFLPATHVVDAMRAAMFGVFQSDFWISLGTLVLFVVPFLILGLVLRKPIKHLIDNYVEKVEKAKIME